MSFKSIEDDLNHLRTSSDEFHKWTAGISIFFITISLTVLTFQEGEPVPHNLITLYISLFFLLTNVFLTWWGLKSYLRVLQIIAEYNVSKRLIATDETELNKKKKRANPLQKSVEITFILGFLSFIAFLLSYIVC